MMNSKLELDGRHDDKTNKSIVFGNNMMYDVDNKSIVNEKGQSVHYTEETDYDIVGIVELPTGYVVCSTDGTNGRIVVVDDDGTDTPIVDDVNIDFNTDSNIEGIYTYNKNRELIILLWNGVNNYSFRPILLNLDNLPFTVHATTKAIQTKTITGGGTGYPVAASKMSELGRMFPNLAQPGLTAYTEIGGSLPTGSYLFYISYFYDKQLNRTPYFGISNTISITYTTYADFEDERTVSDKYVQLYLENLALEFSHFTIAVVIRNEDSIKAYEVGTFVNDSLGGIYEIRKLGTEISVNDVIIPKNTFEAFNTGVVLKNRFNIAGVKVPYFNYQKYANAIIISSVIDDMETLDASNVFKTTAMPGEVYGLFAHLRFKNGYIGQGFHIPGRVSGTYAIETGAVISEEDTLLDYQTAGGTYTLVYEPTNQELASSDGGKVFHTRDTTSGNNMGFWENATEVYPDTDDFAPADIDGSPSADLRGVKVRHHRFPDMETIKIIIEADPPFNDSTFNNRVGISVSNIYIPSEIEDLVDGVIISYAKRDSTNSTILGISPQIPNDWHDITLPDESVDFNIRTYDFGILHKHEQLPIGYFKGLYTAKITSIPARYMNVETATVITHKTNDIVNISSAEYLMEDNSETTVSNKGKEETLLCTTGGGAILTGNRFQVVDANYWVVMMAQIRNDVRNVFTPFYTQAVAFTDKVIPVVGGINNSTLEIYGFDCKYNKITEVNLNNDDQLTLVGGNSVTSGVKYRIKYDTDEGNAVADHLVALGVPISTFADQPVVSAYGPAGTEFTAIDTIAIESDMGIYLLELAEKYKILYPNISVVYSDAAYKPSASSLIFPTFDKYKYNDGFSYVNDLATPIVKNAYVDNLSTIYDTIYRSIVQQKESNVVSFRHFLANEYYVLREAETLDILKLSANDDMLLIQTLNKLFEAKLKDVMVTKDAQDLEFKAYLGQEDIFDRPPREILYSKQGVIGSKNKYGTKITEFGYVTIDADRGEVHFYDGKQVYKISNQGVRQFLMDNLVGVTNADLPFTTTGLILGYDVVTKTLFLSNTDASNKFTLSYNMELKGWIMLHDWYSRYMFSTRNSFYSVGAVGADHAVLKHNSGNRGLFYAYAGGPTYHKSYIDIVFNEPKGLNKLVKGFLISMDISDSTGVGEVRFKDKTFTHIMVYNTKQCSGIIPIEFINSWLGSDNIEKDFDNWVFNDFKDIVVDDDLPNLTQNVALSDATLMQPTANVDATTLAWYQKNFFIGSYVVIRLIYVNDTNNYKVSLKDVNVNFKNK